MGVTFRLCGDLYPATLVGLEVRVIPEMGDIPVMDRLVTVLAVGLQAATEAKWPSWSGLPHGRPLPIRVPPFCLVPA